MKTTKPISTISYNSFSFLQGTLDRLVTAGLIDFYAFIEHDPEEDEEKRHWHVYAEPCNAVDLNWLRKQFIEIDPANPKLPLGTLKWGKSNFYDWYWYCLHDPAYLASKGQSRKYRYEHAQVLTNDLPQLMENVRQNPLKQSQLELIRTMLAAGYPPLLIAQTLNVKAKELRFTMDGIMFVAEDLKQITDRNGKPNHEALPVDNDGVIDNDGTTED